MSACERHVHHAARSLHSYTHPPQPPVSHQPTAEGDVPGEVRAALPAQGRGVKTANSGVVARPRERERERSGDQVIREDPSAA